MSQTRLVTISVFPVDEVVRGGFVQNLGHALVLFGRFFFAGLAAEVFNGRPQGGAESAIANTLVLGSLHPFGARFMIWQCPILSISLFKDDPQYNGQI